MEKMHLRIFFHFFVIDQVALFHQVALFPPKPASMLYTAAMKFVKMLELDAFFTYKATTSIKFLDLAHININLHF